MPFLKCFLATVIFFAPLAQATEPHCIPGQVDEFSQKFTSHRTGYYPFNNAMQGGVLDRKTRPLNTLQDFLKGKASYVSVAMDANPSTGLPYGTKLRIPAVELAFNRCIEFRVVDTGGRFKNKGTSKIDVCNDNREDAIKDFTNGVSEVFRID